MEIKKDEIDNFSGFVRENLEYWNLEGKYSASNTEGSILVDLLHSRGDVLVRSLFIAKCLQKRFGLKLIGLVGASSFTRDVLGDSNRAATEVLARSYGVNEFVSIDVPEEPDFPVIASSAKDFSSIDVFDSQEALNDCGEDAAKKTILDWRSVDNINVGKYVFDTVQRVSFSPKFDVYNERISELIKETYFIHNKTNEIFENNSIYYFVTSHIDYNLWGLVSEVALSHDVRVVYFRVDGDLSVFLLNEAPVAPETLGSLCRRAETSIFERFIWPRRLELRALAEKTIDFLNTGNQMYPPWWNREALKLGDQAPRRDDVAQRLGFDSEKPVMSILTHAMTDEVRFDTQPFADCYDWLRLTLDHARTDRSKNWLVKIHPHDAIYDRSSAVEQLGEDYADAPNIKFIGDELTKSELFAVSDVAITVRGSLGFEMAAAGKRVVLAGRSRMSDIGFAAVADSEEEYFSLISESASDIDRSEERIERAKFYIMYNRMIAPVSSGFVPNLNICAGSDIWTELPKRLQTSCIDLDSFYRNFALSLDLELPRVVNVEYLRYIQGGDQNQADPMSLAVATGTD